jgi:tagatose-1,6-bisphosphate aldolase
MNPKIFTQNNFFFMLALDHRGSFVKLAKTENQQELIDYKFDIINSLIYQFSGVLIDDDFGFKAYTLFNKDILKPFLLPIEKSGFVDSNEGRLNEVFTSASEIKEKGASGVKLLIYFNKKDKNAKKQIELTRVVSEQCKQDSVPLFLEIVHYGEAKDVLDTLNIFRQEGIHPAVYKLEYPGSEKNCKAITEFLEDTPWILLSRGVTFKEFYNQVFIAAKSGCSGFLAGRSLWQDLFEMEGTKRKEFLAEELPNRFKKLKELFL